MRGTVLGSGRLRDCFLYVSAKGAVAGVRFMHVVKVFVKTAVPGDKLDSGSVVFSIVFE